MTEPNKIPAREDVEVLAREIRDLKETLRDVSGKLGRIEKRLRVFFPAAFPQAKSRSAKGERLETSPPTMTTDQLLAVYNDLVNLARSDRPSQVEGKLDALALGDLALLVRELGAPVGGKPTRPLLVRSVLGRLKQSVMLSRHTPRPTSSSTSTAPNAADESQSPDSETSEPEHK